MDGLFATIRNGINQLSEFNELLAEELVAIKNLDPELMLQYTERKAGAAQELESISDQIRHFLEKAGVTSAGRDNKAALLEYRVELANRGITDLPILIDEFIQLAEKCRTDNLVTAQVISVSRHHTQERLTILNGGKPVLETYSSDGTPDAAQPGKILGVG